MVLSASGGVGDRPRLLDSANPRCEGDTGGDPDLGAPNKKCTPSGPGRGVGGNPGKPGENCDPLGNVLIIQEPSSDHTCPDDNQDGGMIVFEFVEPAEIVYAMGFLDIDEPGSTVTVSHMTEEGMVSTVLDLPDLGDNSKQILEINIGSVKEIKVTLAGSGAVTFIDFCYDADTTEPPFTTRPPTGAPSLSPTAAPTGSPTTSPTGSPTDSPTASPTSSPTAAPTPTPSGKVKGTVFEDVNNNGEQDPDEPPIEGVDVVITDSEGNVFTLTTDATGMYMAEVPIGETVIDIDESTLPPGYEQTVGTDPTTVDVPAGGTATDLDGYYFPTEAPTKAPTSAPTSSPTDLPTSSPTSSPTGAPTASPSDSPTVTPTAGPTAAPTPTPFGKIKGTIFEDTNKNGVQDPGEPPLVGVVVVITDSNGEKSTLTTDGTGMYMTEVPAGPTVTDIVESSLPPGAEQTVGTDPTTVDVPAGGTGTDLDGYYVPTDSPTASPTDSPTGSPTGAPTPKPCVNATVTFDVDADGNAIAPGEFVEYEWAKFGLVLSASGGVGDRPRLLTPRIQDAKGTLEVTLTLVLRTRNALLLGPVEATAETQESQGRTAIP